MLVPCNPTYINQPAVTRSKLPYCYLEDDRVYVLSEQVEEKPVPHVAFPHYCVYALLFHSPERLQWVEIISSYIDRVMPSKKGKDSF